MDTRQKVGKTHERYNERKPVSIFTIDETITPSQFKLQGFYTPRKTKDRNSDSSTIESMAENLLNLVLKL